MDRVFIARPAFFLAVGMTLLTVTAFAQNPGNPPQGQGGGDHPHGPPPPEAIAACQGKASGATCSFVGRQGEQLTGTCFIPPPRGGGGQQGGQQNTTPPQGNSDNQSAKPMACRPARR